MRGIALLASSNISGTEQLDEGHSQRMIHGLLNQELMAFLGLA